MQSAPLVFLGILLIALEFVHAGSQSFLSEIIPGAYQATSDVDRCSGHFPGLSFERLILMGMKTGTLKSLSVGFPSYYMMFMGALFGYIYGASQTYENELKGFTQKRVAVYSGIFIMGLLSLMFVVFRITSGCDTLFSVGVGSFIGIAYGYLLEKLLAYISDRKLTNLMNIPLIRNRAEDGKPIYVCKKA
jgi:hypothetical protein